MKPAIGYKMTHDNGFAPNPFHGYLSLATCKPSIRRTRGRDDWVAGFASKALVRNAKAYGVAIPYMGLVYLMQVTEQPMPLAAYFEDKRFAKKKPNMASREPKLRCGDNIYSSDGLGGYQWWPNDFHPKDYLWHDTRGINALISAKFWYFGRNAFVPQEGWSQFLGAQLSEARTFYCPQAFVERIQDHFASTQLGLGVHGDPCMWDLRSKSSCSR